MNWDVYSYGSGDFLRLVFNGVASIFGNADYAQAMSVSALIGFIAIMFMCAFDKAALNNFKWLIAIIFLYQAAVVPKQTVIITDRVIPANSSVVSNVPLGLAMTAGFFSSVSDYLTRTFETVFAPPNGLKYSTSGMLFGHRLLDASKDASIPNERTYLNFSDFFATCIVVDGIGNNRFTWEDVMKSNDLVTFFSTKPAINAASFLYRNSLGVKSILPCRSGFSNYLKADLNNLSNDIIARMATNLVGQTGSAAAARLKISSDMQSVLNYLTGVNKSASTSAVQFALSNAITGGLTTISKQVNDNNTMLGLVMARAEVERQTTYKAMGAVAGEKLPLLRGLFEAFIYAIFPIVILMALVIPTKVPMAYVKTLIWINLWPPLYALINFAAQYHSRGALTDIASLSGGFSAIANTKMQLYVTDMADTAGYMASSIPIIAWMFVSGSGALASSLADRVMKGYDTSVQKGAEEVTKGEGKFLGVNWQQTADGHMQTSYMNDLGTQTTRAGGGQEFINQAQSTSPFAIQAVHNLAQDKKDEVGRAIQNEHSTSAKASESSAALLAQSNSALNSVLNSTSAGSSAKSAVTSALQQQEQNTEQSFRNYLHDNNISLDKNSQMKMEAALKAGTPLESLVGSGASASVGANHTVSKAEKDAYQAAKGFTQSEQYSELASKNASLAREVLNSSNVSADASVVNGLNSAYQQQTSAAHEHSQAVSDVKSAKESYAQTETISESINMNNTDAFIQKLAHTGMSIGQVDQMLRSAANGDEAAKMQLNQRLEAVNMMGGMDADFFDKQQLLNANNNLNTMYADGSAGVDQVYSSSQGQVRATADANAAKVQVAGADVTTQGAPVVTDDVSMVVTDKLQHRPDQTTMTDVNNMHKAGNKTGDNFVQDAFNDASLEAYSENLKNQYRDKASGE